MLTARTLANDLALKPWPPGCPVMLCVPDFPYAELAEDPVFREGTEEGDPGVILLQLKPGSDLASHLEIPVPLEPVSVFKDGDIPVELFQKGPDDFMVKYGEEVAENLSYEAAADRFGQCVLHSLSCKGSVDNSKPEKQDPEE